MEAIEFKTSDLDWAFFSLRRLIEKIENRNLREENNQYQFSFLQSSLQVTTPQCFSTVLSINIPYPPAFTITDPIFFLVHKQFSLIIHTIKKDYRKVTLMYDQEEKNLIVEHKTGMFKIRCQELSPQDIQTPRVASNVHVAKLSPELVQKGLRYTSEICPAHSDQRGKITEYVHMDIKNGVVEFAGSDRKGVFTYKAKVDDEQLSMSCNIHSKYIDIIKKLLDYGLDSVTTDGELIVFDRKWYRFVIPEAFVQYPNYHRIIPSSNEYAIAVHVSRLQFVHAVKLANSCSRNTVIRIMVANGKVTFTGRDMKDRLCITESIPYIYSNGTFTVSVNGSMLAMTLNEGEEETIAITYIIEKKLVTITPLGGENVFHLLVSVAE